MKLASFGIEKDGTLRVRGAERELDPAKSYAWRAIRAGCAKDSAVRFQILSQSKNSDGTFDVILEPVEWLPE